jgi:hypothetical protein
MDDLAMDEYGNRRWYDKDGELHRDDGPASIHVSGVIMWCQHGKYHRTDGPAIIYADEHGSVEWWLDDNHCSIEGWRDHVTVDWFLNNVEYTFDEWLEQSDISGEEKVMLKLKYGQYG